MEKFKAKPKRNSLSPLQSKIIIRSLSVFTRESATQRKPQIHRKSMQFEKLETLKEKAKKSKRGFSSMTQMKPANIAEEKEKFYLSNGFYNPQFFYTVKDIKMWYCKSHSKYLKQAMRILEDALSPFSKDPKSFENSGGKILTQDESENAFMKYIASLNLQDSISLEFCTDSVVQTYVNHLQKGICKIVIGIPVRYRHKSITGVLHHEIGTHILRKNNDRAQIWHKKRKKYNLSDFMMIEEGLAAINQQISAV